MLNQLLQLSVAGVAQGCVYALVALGFVLIYKATETVNFAQGDLMMLGAFFALTASVILGWPYWATILFAVAAMAVVGMLIERLVLRPVLGQPAFTVVMITIGVGYVLRGVVTMMPGWGTDTFTLPTPFSEGVLKFGGVIFAVQQLAVIGMTTALCAVLYVFFRYAKLGVAMQATSQNQLAAAYMGIPVRRVNMLVWGLSAGVAAFAGILLAPVTFVHSNMGFIGLKAFPAAVVGGFGSVPGRHCRWTDHRPGRSACRVLPARRIQGRRRLCRRPRGAADQALGHLRRNRQEEGVSHAVHFQNAVRAGHPPVQARGPEVLVRAAHGGPARGTVRARRVRHVADALRAHLFDRRPGADAAGGFHRADFARPRGLPRGRGLHRGAAAGQRRAVLVSLPCAALFAAVLGLVVGLPALRLKGIYLAIATLAFNVIVEEVITRWESLTGGNSGLHLKPVELFGLRLDGDAGFYYLCLALTILCVIALLNLLRSPTGRAFVAIRDSEISASCMGVNLAKYKTLSFAISAALTGIGGALYAHKVTFISPEQFTLLQSIELVTIVILGGVGSLHGAVLGAAFLIVLPQLISVAKDYLPGNVAGSGLQSIVFGMVLIGFIVFEPLGLYGRWLKVRTWFELFPFYRRGMFRRQKSYMKSERLR